MPSDINCLLNASIDCPSVFCNGVNSPFLNSVCSDRQQFAHCAVDKGEVFLTQRFDDAIDVIGGVLFEPGPEFPVFVVVLL